MMADLLTEPGLSFELEYSVAKYIIIEEFCANCGVNKIDWLLSMVFALSGCPMSKKLPWYERIGSPRLYDRNHVWRETRRESSFPF